MQGYLIMGTLSSEPYKNFIPLPLPPVPAINLAEVSENMDMASRAIGELNGAITEDINPALINYMFVRKEAVLSSQIEGTQGTLDDLLKFESAESPGLPIDDAIEASSYSAAMNHAVERLSEGFPLCMRLIREIHQILLSNTRGHGKMPGELRTTQNWIGGSRPGNAKFVPPPPDMVPSLLGDLENFIHADDKITGLLKAALIHIQFETIHPFLDGNGRVGRILITLFLFVKGYLKSPLLYLSLFFKNYRDDYYEKIKNVRESGDWEDWINFFLEGIVVTAQDAQTTFFAIKKLFAHDGERAAALGRPSTSALLVLEEFKKKPMQTVATLTKATGKTKPTVIASVNHLTQLGIIKNISARKWGKLYSYDSYIALMRPGTELD
ncbi:cell division protein Fic [Spirochaetia bacterium]|nr:cell division protein Fic [Spirochaetia bacterium]